MNNLLYNIALSIIPGVGAVTARHLIARYGSSANFFREYPKSQIKKLVFSEKDVLYKAQRELDFIDKNKIKTLFFTDGDYPKRLSLCDDAPPIIFVKGDTDLNSQKIISIVGTRKATHYGINCCEKLIADISSAGLSVVIVSGLAYGIDICAHKSALSNGLKTFAVLGTGINKVYPAAHHAIAKQIEGQGALITEFISDASVFPGNFLSRNRVIAGMSDATIVVESGGKGGALVTADIAGSYNRDVLAFPGRAGDESSMGCNAIIKSNKAAMIENLNDLLTALNWDTKNKNIGKQISLFSDVSDEESQIISILKNKGSENIDDLARSTGFPLPDLSALLLNLEFKGLVKSLPGKNYAAVCNFTMS